MKKKILLLSITVVVLIAATAAYYYHANQPDSNLLVSTTNSTVKMDGDHYSFHADRYELSGSWYACRSETNMGITNHYPTFIVFRKSSEYVDYYIANTDSCFDKPPADYEDSKLFKHSRYRLDQYSNPFKQVRWFHSDDPAAQLPAGDRRVVTATPYQITIEKDGDDNGEGKEFLLYVDVNVTPPRLYTGEKRWLENKSHLRLDPVPYTRL